MYAITYARDNNFSKERLDFYYDLARNVLKEKSEKLNAEQKEHSDKEENLYFNTSKSNNKANPLYVGVALGGLIIGGAGLIMGKTVLATIGFVSAAIGGGLLYNDRKKKQ